METHLFIHEKPPRRQTGGVGLDFLNELRLQLHRTESINLTIDIVIPVDETDPFDTGPLFDDKRRALHF